MYNQQPLPFHMAYPTAHLIDVEQEQEQQVSLMKEYYPEEAMIIQEYVENECDKLEYEGSMMYDEYPDKIMMKQLCNRIERIVANSIEEEVQSQQWRGDHRDDRYDQYCRDERCRNRRNLVEVLLFNEFFRRRCRYGRCRRYF